MEKMENERGRWEEGMGGPTEGKEGEKGKGREKKEGMGRRKRRKLVMKGRDERNGERMTRKGKYTEK